MNECEHFIRDPFVRSIVVPIIMIAWTWTVYMVGLWIGVKVWPK